jgi:N-acetylglucosaminyldiphosphoundecaprenol N-acetyl-beta-D-mannosaminyltransferase
MTRTVGIFGVPVAALNVEELHGCLRERIAQGERTLALNVNVHALNLAYEQPWMLQFFHQADLVFCDGTGVILAARMLGSRIPERITYADWAWKLAAFGAAQGYSFFYLGGKPGVAEKAALRLTARFPDLKTAGCHDGYFNKSPGGAENASVIREINATRPDILIVGFGMPIQERWLCDNWERIDAKVLLTGGAVFDYVSGNLRRAPRWMTDHGLEWLGRLIIEPRRLWKRYLIGNPLFFYRMLKQRLGLVKFE